MHKPTFTSTLILATGILLTTLSAQGMRSKSQFLSRPLDLFGPS